MRSYIFLVFILLYNLSCFAEKNPDPRSSRKSITIEKTFTAPKINGYADDSIWSNIPVISDFHQYKPVYGAAPSLLTEVRIVYDDYAIYVFAHMFDPNPDSILRQLGLRDEEHLNADMFSIAFDTYNNQLDAYYFLVTASGVQIDSRETDDTYDAVWDSEVQILKNGWTVEMKIPYSAIRFARQPSQLWGMEISRTIRRYRETVQWSLEALDSHNDLPYWGTLKGIANVEPPLRLSATPYILLQAEHFPSESTGNDISTGIGGGMDLKYGISESYTIDVSLLPDFSQVQSDNKVKNLTAFETVYKEQRPFFKEAVDLFMKGDIFYSRRIGKTPAGFYSVDGQLNDNEYLKKNPVQQKLVNATKISGRDKKGLAIGLLNAITANTNAIAEDEEGNTRKILTDPLTNYNLIVIDQALKNNSNFYITNTNVIRNSTYRDANVTASGLTLNDKSNTYRLNISGGVSQIFTSQASEEISRKNNVGYKYGFSFLKTKGNFQFSAGRSGMNEKFNANDMGLTLYNNYHITSASVSYNIYKPFWLFRDMSNKLAFSNQNNFTTHKPENTKLRYNSFITTLNYFSIWVEAGHLLTETYDYYEPRTQGMYYLKPISTWGSIGFSTDYRKPFALDGHIGGYYSARDDSKGFSVECSPIMRLNNHFSLNMSFSYEKNLNDYGFADKEDELVIFGNRDINTITNSIGSKYLFNNDISLSLNARYYHSTGEYDSFYNLLDNGRLEPQTEYNEVQDFNFNSANIDMVFSWIFAPGSSLNLVWKNEITTESQNVNQHYFNNINSTYQEPQLNSISLKVLYYIDYQRLKNNEG